MIKKKCIKCGKFSNKRNIFGTCSVCLSKIKIEIPEGKETFFKLGENKTLIKITEKEYKEKENK